MCQILFATDRPATAQEIRDAAALNADGMGVAWRDAGMVRVARGLAVDDVVAGIDRLPLPYAIHARMATVGGSAPELTHPFRLRPNPTPDLDYTARSVLFHNGHVSEWEALLVAAGVDPDRGLWSDTRAIAHIVAMRGTRILRYLQPSRFLLFGRHRAKMIGQWHDQDGLWTSSPMYPVAVERSLVYADLDAWIARHRARGGQTDD